MFPLKLNFAMRLPFINPEKLVPRMMKRLKNPEYAAADPQNIAERALPSSLPIHVSEILPRVAEGGAFVKFSHEPQNSLMDLEQAIKKYLKENPIKPWFNPFQRVRTNLVQGRPWVEDLYRVPSSRLKVEFVPTAPGQSAEELSQETLYSLFRRYGKLIDIKPQPTDSKELPKFAYLQFNKARHAIMAKNCMHGFTLPASEGGGETGTMLKLVYQHTKKVHWIWDWLSSHPRIVIPLLLAFFGTATVAIFDP